jgi:hypothetical protein
LPQNPYRWRVAMARVREAGGDREGARECGVAPDDDLSYIREFEHTTLAMVLLAGYRTQRAERPLDDAAQLLQRLLQAAEAAERTGSVIEILVLQGLVQQARGDAEAALAHCNGRRRRPNPKGMSACSSGTDDQWRRCWAGSHNKGSPGTTSTACCSPAANPHPFLLGPFPLRVALSIR